MKIEATLRLPGDLLWVGEGAEMPDGFAIQGPKPGEFKFFHDGREIGVVVTWPRTESETIDEMGGAKEIIVQSTEVDCVLDWDALTGDPK